jgi:hypothetical protein
MLATSGTPTSKSRRHIHGDRQHRDHRHRPPLCPRRSTSAPASRGGTRPSQNPMISERRSSRARRSSARGGALSLAPAPSAPWHTGALCRAATRLLSRTGTAVSRSGTFGGEGRCSDPVERGGEPRSRAGHAQLSQRPMQPGVRGRIQVASEARVRAWTDETRALQRAGYAETSAPTRQASGIAPSSPIAPEQPPYGHH